MPRWRQSAATAALLVALAAVLTWPLLPRLGSAVADLGDPLLTSWTLAWDLHALRHAPLGLFDANMFHPHRWTLAYTEPLLGLLPLALPVRLAGGDPVLAHNAVLFATFPLAGLTMFWLVRHLTGQAGAGVVAGILYAFSGYRFGHLGHVQLLSHQWVPLVLLGLHRAVASGGRWRDLGLVALAFALQALSSGYYAYFTVIVAGVFALWVAGPAIRPPLGRLVRRGLVVGTATGLLLGPLFVPFGIVRREVGLVRRLEEIRHYSARPSSYLAAPPVNRWLGDLTAPLRRPDTTLFPGAVAVVLAVVGTAGALSAGRRGRRADAEVTGPPEAAARRWPRALDLALTAFLLVTLANALFVGGFALTLGPLRVSQRHVEGSLLLIGGALGARRLLRRTATPLPGLGGLRRLGGPHAAGCYVGLTVVGVLCTFGPTLWVFERPVAEPLYHLLYKWVPGFSGLRVPSRFAVLAITGLAVLAGYGAAAVAARLPGRAARRATLAVLGGLAAVEAWAVPLPLVTAPPRPGPGDRWLATAPAPGAVVVLPLFRDVHREAARLLGSTTHWRPLVNGYGGFFPPEYLDTVETLNTFPSEPAVARLRTLEVRYVVVSLGQYGREARARMEAGLKILPPGVVEAAALEHTVILEVQPRGP
jgi:hypothetical protein